MTRIFISIIGFMTCVMFLGANIHGEEVQEWTTITNFMVKQDSSGWKNPVDLVFVPSSENVEAPEYFVLEYDGNIYAVNRQKQRTLYSDLLARPLAMPDASTPLQLSGLCVAPEQGWLYAVAIGFNGGRWVNRIVRFEHGVTGFAMKPVKWTEFDGTFQQESTVLSRSITHCEIGPDQKLYVGIGDGGNSANAQNMASWHGKILRMNLDFTAPQDNPLYEESNPQSPASYVFAYGFMNPVDFAIDPQGTVYVVDLGAHSRLIEIIPGQNYYWDGDAETLKINGIWVDPGYLGVSSLTYTNKDPAILPLANRLLIAYSGILGIDESNQRGARTIKSFLLKQGRGLQTAPERLLWYQGEMPQLLTSIAQGRDGIYFTVFFPDRHGENQVLKIVPGKSDLSRSFQISGMSLFQDKGCEGCHKINGVGGSMGPALDGLVDRIRQRIESPEYLTQLNQIDKITTEPHTLYQEARDKLRQLHGEEGVRFWIQHRLKEPRFDVEQSQMPQLNLSDADIETLSNYLMALQNTQTSMFSPSEDLHRRFKVWWDTSVTARPAIAFVIGVGLTFGVRSLFRRILRLFRKKAV
ncbi:MAG: PQQ-dependent sugar dehydrogenase [SAR324 cluster bacterium]|nr:PQQ-dependent sugar dehydrogenase [SAR324 cluster bacterium]